MLIVENAEERQRIGDTIRQARKNKKITQTQLGTEIGIGKVAVANYESGKIKVIPFEKRVKLASILDIPITALLYDNEIGTHLNVLTPHAIFPGAAGIKIQEDANKAYEDLLQSIVANLMSSDEIKASLQEITSKALLSYRQLAKQNKDANKAYEDLSKSIAEKIAGNILEILSAEAANDKQK